MIKTGFVIAMPRECAPLLEKAEITAVERVMGKQVHIGTLCGKPFAVCVCGIGKVAAATGVFALAKAFKPDAIINAGIAGGLGVTPRGAAVIARKVWQHDFDTTAAGDEPGLFAGECDERLSERLAAATQGIAGTVATGDVFVADKVRAKRIAELFGASACDMECAGALEAANALEIPFAAVKYVSDGADAGAGEDYGDALAPLADRIARDTEKYFSSEE